MENHPLGLNAGLRGWLTYLKSEGKIPEKDLLEIIKEDEVLQEAHKTYNKFLSNAELMEAYEGRQRWLHDQATIREEAREDGIKEGEKKGVIQAAKGMKVAGADMELIRRSTGLSKKEIEKL